MTKKAVFIITVLALLLSLCGCGSVYDKEYISIDDYLPPESASHSYDEKITVHNLNALKQSGVGTRVGPEHTLVLRGVERHAVKRHIDAAVGRAADAHRGGAGAETVLAPTDDTRGA